MLYQYGNKLFTKYTETFKRLIGWYFNLWGVWIINYSGHKTDICIQNSVTRILKTYFGNTIGIIFDRERDLSNYFSSTLSPVIYLWQWEHLHKKMSPILFILSRLIKTRHLTFNHVLVFLNKFPNESFWIFPRLPYVF